MLKVQEYLLTHSFTDLYTDHGVCARPSKDGSKYSLNYDQITVKNGDPLANECRGLIIRPVRQIATDVEVVSETAVVARPMDRFYNAGDPNAADIDWHTARVQHKLDGTMIILYWDSVKNEWCVGTRSVPEADVLFGDCVSPLKENTFRELFFYAAEKTVDAMCMYWDMLFEHPFQTWINLLNQSYTYVFELTSPINRVVVKYSDYRITLLAIRETVSGRYIPYDRTTPYFNCVQEWPLKTLSDIESFLLNTKPDEIEGAVVIDGNNNRIKVKSKQWVLASRAKDSVSMSKRNALQSIIDGTIDDVIPLLDEGLQQYLIKLQANTAEYLKKIDQCFVNLRGTSADRKSFALDVQASGLWQTPMFVRYSENKWQSTVEWLQYLSREKKLTDSYLDLLLKEVSK